MSRVIIEIGKRKFRTVNNGNCCKRDCSLFESGVCDFDGDDKDLPKEFPCDKIIKASQKNGMWICLGTTFKEVK